MLCHLYRQPVARGPTISIKANACARLVIRVLRHQWCTRDSVHCVLSVQAETHETHESAGYVLQRCSMIDIVLWIDIQLTILHLAATYSEYP